MDTQCECQRYSQQLNISKKIELIDWDTAYNLALNEDNIVLFQQ